MTCQVHQAHHTALSKVFQLWAMLPAFFAAGARTQAPQPGTQAAAAQGMAPGQARRSSTLTPEEQAELVAMAERHAQLKVSACHFLMRLHPASMPLHLSRPPGGADLRGAIADGSEDAACLLTALAHCGFGAHGAVLSHSKHDCSAIKCCSRY